MKRFFTNDTLLLKSFVLLMILNTLVLLGSQWFVYTKHFDFSWFCSFFYREVQLFTSYFLVFWILSLLPKAIKFTLLGIILLLSIAIFILEVFLLHHFDTNLNSYLVIVALESNPAESKDFLANYLTLDLFALYVICIIFCFVILRFLKPFSLNLKAASLSVICGICICILMAISGTRPINENWSDMLYNATKQIYRALEGTYKFVKEYQKLEKQFDLIASSYEIKPTSQAIDNIVLVIGESTQRNRLSLYGYSKPTTPLLESLKQSKPQNLLVFSNIIAPHAQTHESLSLSLTMANQDNTQNLQTTKKKYTQKQWYEYPNIIDSLTLGGYKTISISNQEPISLFGNAAATLLKRSKIAEFINVNDKMSTTKFDESILEVLDGVLQNKLENGGADSKEPLFFALHLMGNHAKYYNRYPSDFARFSPQDYSQESESKRQENAHYDNSVLYGDFVLSEIIKRFEQSDSIVIFFSDHGEEIYDFRDFIGHSDSKLSHLLVEIPFIIYVSDEFKLKHQALYKRILNAQKQRYMNDDLFHSILDIAGVKLKGFESKRSLFSRDKSLLDSRLRLVGNKSGAKDYDKELAPKILKNKLDSKINSK